MSLELKLGIPREPGTIQWPAWIKHMELILREKHPCIGNALSKGNRGLELITPAQEEEPDGQENAQARAARLGINARNEKRAYTENKEKREASKTFYASMLRACSAALLEEVRGNSEYEEMNANQDLITLKRVLEIASSTQKGASDVDVLDGTERDWSNLSMNRTETLSEWKDRVETAANKVRVATQKMETRLNLTRAAAVRVDVGAIVGKSDEIQALKFVKRLDPARWADLQTHLVNQTLLDPDARSLYPTTLTKAFHLADVYQVKSLRNEAGEVNPRATITLASQIKPAEKGKRGGGKPPGVQKTAAAATTTTTGGSKRKQKRERKKAAYAAAVAATADGGDAAKSADASPVAASYKPPAKTGVSLTACRKCGKEGHWQRDCKSVGPSKCSNCGKSGHEAKDCWSKKAIVAAAAIAEDSSESDASEEWHTVLLTKTVMTNASIKDLTKWSMIADSGSAISVVHNRDMLENLESVDPIKIIGSTTKETKKLSMMGNIKKEHGGLGTAYYDPTGSFNIISISQTRLTHDTHFNEHGLVIDTKPHKTLFSLRRNGLYVFNAEPTAVKRLRNKQAYVATTPAFVDTVAQRMREYTNQETRRADTARELQLSLGCTSKALKHALQHGVIVGTDVTPEDVERSNKIYGTNITQLKGSTVYKTLPAPKPVSVPTRELETNLIAYIDIFHVLGIHFILAVLQPTDVTIMQPLKHAYTKKDVSEALEKLKAEATKHGYNIRKFITDSEQAIIKSVIPGLHEDVGTAEHVKKAERRGRLVKERMRGLITSGAIPFVLDELLLTALVRWVCDTIGMLPSKNSGVYTTPREFWTGRKTSAKTDLPLRFGTYCQVHQDGEGPERSQVDSPRTLGCIALHSSANERGSYRFLNIATWEMITRRTWTALPWPTPLLQLINERGLKMRKFTERELQHFLNDTDAEFAEIDSIEADRPQAARETTNDRDKLTIEIGDGGAENHTDAAHDITEDIAAQDENEENAPDEPTTPQPANWAQDVADTATRIAAGHVYGTRSKSRLTVQATLTNLMMNQAIEKRGQDNTRKAIEKEILGLHTTPVWKPVHLSDLSKSDLPRGKPIGSGMFLKEKFHASGDFDLLKARLVSRGNHQDPLLYTDAERSAPTPSTTAVLSVVAVAAGASWSKATYDIPKAYTNAFIKKKVYMTIDKRITAIYRDVAPEIGQYIGKDGTLTVELLRALYGCVESARLWSDHYAAFMESRGFYRLKTEPCVWRRGSDDKFLTVIIYVDDGLVAGPSEQEVTNFGQELQAVFGAECRFKIGKELEYLGMALDFTKKGVCRVTMPKTLSGILADYTFQCRKHKTPAADDLFRVDQESPKLDRELTDVFYSLVYRLLYVAKRVVPEILTAVQFLTTRVTKSTEEDLHKLVRVLKYLEDLEDPAIYLSADPRNMKVKVSADASFACHEDAKSQTGLTATLGEGPILVKSKKQKSVTKSSTGAELKSASEGASDAV